MLLSFSGNDPRSGSIVVVGDPIFENVSGFGVVVAEGEGLRGHHFTEARAPKWTKVSKLPRRDALAATPSLNNNIVYRIYCLFNGVLVKNLMKVAIIAAITAKHKNENNKSKTRNESES